jgi:hypothetical protein
MFDPGAMGTLVLGLDRQRRQRELGAMESPSRPVPAPGRRSGLSIALALARVLRVMADRLDPKPTSTAVSAAR